jgi:hypothetical protein
MKEIRTWQEAGESFFDESEAYDGEKGRNPRHCKDPVANLEVSSFGGTILEAGHEADLLRKARAGDPLAKDRLAQSFDRLVKKIASQYSGPSRGDRIAAGHLGLAEAIHRYDLRRNTRFGTYAQHWIRKLISEEVRIWRRAGQAGETRADRYAYRNSTATAEDISAKVGCTVSEAEKAIQRVRGHDKPYDTREGFYDEEGNYRGPRLAASSVMYAMYGCFSRYQLSPHLRRHEAASRTIDAMVVDLEKRAELRLKAMGRKDFALWLVRRARRRRHHVDEGETPRMKAEYTISINTSSSASDSTDWKDNSTRLAEIEAAHPPMVWSERDKWGSYRTVDVRPKTLRALTMNKPAKPSHSDQANNNESAAVAA